MKTQTEIPRLLFADETHGDAKLFRVDIDAHALDIGNQLFRLEQDGASITLTGEQLDSLSKQWRMFHLTNAPAARKGGAR